MSTNTGEGRVPGRLVLFACEQRLGIEGRYLEQAAATGGFALRVLRLPCSSALEPAMVLRAFEGDAEAVGVLACRPEACRLGDGSRRAARRMTRTSKILAEIGLGDGRLLFRDGEPGQGAQATLDELMEAARAAGPSPLQRRP